LVQGDQQALWSLGCYFLTDVGQALSPRWIQYCEWSCLKVLEHLASRWQVEPERREAMVVLKLADHWDWRLLQPHPQGSSYWRSLSPDIFDLPVVVPECFGKRIGQSESSLAKLNNLSPTLVRPTAFLAFLLSGQN